MKYTLILLSSMLGSIFTLWGACHFWHITDNKEYEWTHTPILFTAGMIAAARLFDSLWALFRIDLFDSVIIDDK